MTGRRRRRGPPSRMTRRALLVDLGRASLGAVVLGPGLVGCAAADDERQRDTAAASAGDEASVAWRRASFGFVSAYVLVRGGEALVFDTGTGEDVAVIGDALEDAGAGWGQVAHVVVSHRHDDHVGGVDRVVDEAPAAAVHAAVPDLDVVRARLPAASAITDGDRLLGLRVVATPGHTPGHISLFDDETGLLLAGDAVVNGVAIGGTTGDGVEPSPPSFTADADEALASVRTLVDLAPTTILFGHGDPLTSGASAALEDALGG